MPYYSDIFSGLKDRCPGRSTINYFYMFSLQKETTIIQGQWYDISKGNLFFQSYSAGESLEIRVLWHTSEIEHINILWHLWFWDVCFDIRQLSLHCLVDEVLWRGEIMPDKKKKLTFHHFFIFSSDMPKNQRIFSPKLHQFQLNLLIFTIKTESLSNFFFFFPLTRVKM